MLTSNHLRATELSRMRALICLLQLQAPGLKRGSDTVESATSSDSGATFRSIMEGLLVEDAGVATEVVEAVAVPASGGRRGGRGGAVRGRRGERGGSGGGAARRGREGRTGEVAGQV
jgi:hypothetical protein